MCFLCLLLLFPSSGVECIVVLPEPRSHWESVFGTCVFLFSFLIPVAIISICYSLMVKRLRSVRILSGSKEKDRNLRRITRMVLVVVAAFVVCWTPVQIMVLAQSLGFNLSSLFTLILVHFCIALGYVNSSLNPVLYAFLDENFKRCFRECCHPSPFRLDTQQSGRMRSIAREVAAAYSCRAGDCGPGGGTPNPAWLGVELPLVGVDPPKRGETQGSRSSNTELTLITAL